MQMAELLTLLTFVFEGFLHVISYTMFKINQKEYLKKYLSGEKIKKRRRRESDAKYSKVKIIDDDIDIVRNRLDEDDDLILTGEDAPMIVGIIDDRPPELKTIEDFRSSEKWKSMTINDNTSAKCNTKSLYTSRNIDSIKTEREKILKSQSLLNKSEDNLNFKRNIIKSNEDYSPRRKESTVQLTPTASGRSRSEDFSPPRRLNKFQPYNNSKCTTNSKDKRSSDDYSPPRKNNDRKSSQANISSKRSGSEDLSPPRRKDSSKCCTKREHTVKRKNYDHNPVKKRKDREHWSGSDYSYENRQEHKEKYECSVDLSRIRDDKRKSCVSKSKTQKTEEANLKIVSIDKNKDQLLLNINKIGCKDGSRHVDTSSIERTLDGKKAGLQNAESLKKETEVMRKKENDMFSKMLPGTNTDIVVRDKRLRTTTEIQKEKEEERKKTEREQEKREAYTRWGVGLKQIEDYQSKIACEMHEISKPLARYSDDADLDELLKKQERAGDPMLGYFRQKNQETIKNNNLPSIPIYKGTFPENRFNIRPGFRWDGVDRSNGYEKRWFDTQNQKKAMQEEAYKYSIEDM